MTIEDRIPLIEDILDKWKGKIGGDFAGYKNHVYRMTNFCFALGEKSAEEREKIIIAGCFHDIGIWAGETFDYLPPSIFPAKEYLRQNGLAKWIPEIELMIDQHHKLRAYRDAHSHL